MKLRGIVSSSYIHVSVSDLFIPTIDLPILLQESRWTYRGNIIAHRYMNVETRTEAAQFLFGEHKRVNRIFFAVYSKKIKKNSVDWLSTSYFIEKEHIFTKP